MLLTILLLGSWAAGSGGIGLAAPLDIVALDVPPLLESVLQILPLPTLVDQPGSTPTAISLPTTTTPPACIATSAPQATATGFTESDCSPTPAQTAWHQPHHMTDLDSFNITKFACGAQNLHLVTSIPTSEFAPTSPSNRFPDGSEILLTPVPAPADSLTNTTTLRQTLIRITYPAHSSDPSLLPVGGADLYASPLPLSTLHSATSVSLSYSVFFPHEFDFVRGGKLPGLYGGGYGCSGGKSAEWCWSSRLMWRKEGMGELYLYAPKAAQTPQLCSTPPMTVCNSADGQSIGRGSFNFTRGGWTHVTQRVTLNTPGEWDGKFELWKDWEKVIDLDGVYWRNAADGGGDGQDGGGEQGDGENDGGGGILGLGGILLESDIPNSGNPSFLLRPQQRAASNASRPATPDLKRRDDNPLPERSNLPSKHIIPTFDGIFFSTFFGGSGPSWASPSTQHTWFKDFSLVIHY